jgi:hypothetical protein
MLDLKLTIRASGFSAAGVVFGCILMAGAAAPTPAHAAVCKDFPKVEYWVNDPKAVQKTVDSRFGGDWGKYIDRWRKYQEAMEQNVRSGKSALIKSRNLTLVGETLKAHVEDIKARIEVLECLQAKAVGGEEILPAAATDVGSCPDFPNVDWWVNEPEDIRKSVRLQYKGNWDAYIARWHTYRKNMDQNVRSGKSAVIKSRNLTLAGETLKQHVRHIDQRIAALKCLKVKDEQLAALASDVKPQTASSPAKPAPAPATPPPARRQPTEEVETVAVTGGGLDLEITAKCQAGAPIFQITNLGDRWPKLGTVNIYNTADRSTLSKRRMRLANSQQATFGVPARVIAAKKVKEVGIFIEPGWETRKFAYDSKVIC